MKPALPGIRSVVAVASGKGGVGKSTTSVNLALALARLGQRVGLLDADIYGPSQPRMLGIAGRPRSADGKLLPMENYGVRVMSMGFLVDEDAPMIWRGPWCRARSSRCSATSSGASWTFSWSTCRPAPAMRS